MVLGAILGVVIHNTISAEAALSFSNKVKILATVFIRLVQMIITISFTTLVVGIASWEMLAQWVEWRKGFRLVLQPLSYLFIIRNVFCECS
jgi:Na+/H+-dicarboxylate symporter